MLLVLKKTHDNDSFGLFDLLKFAFHSMFKSNARVKSIMFKGFLFDKLSLSARI